MIRYKREGPCAIAADMLVAAGRDDPPTAVLIFGAGRPAVRGMVGAAPSARLWHGVSCMLGGGGRSARRYRYVGLCVGTVRKVPRVRRVKINPKERKKKKRGDFIWLESGIVQILFQRQETKEN